MTAVDPKRSLTSSSAASSASLPCGSNGSLSWMARPSSRFVTAIPTSVKPRCSISGAATASSPLAAARISCVLAVGCGSVCERLAREKSSKRRRSTTVRPTRPAVRIRRVTRSTSATSDVSISANAVGERPRARCAPIERRRRRLCTGRGISVVGERVEVPARRPPEQRYQRRLGELGDLTNGGDPERVELRRGHGADAPEPLDRQRVQEGALTVRRHQEQAVGLGHPARNLRQELRPRDPDRDRQTDPFADVTT